MTAAGAEDRPLGAMELAAWLRAVARRSSRLRSEDRRRVIRLCLAYRLSGRGLGAVLDVVRRLEHHFAGGERLGHPGEKLVPPSAKTTEPGLVDERLGGLEERRGVESAESVGEAESPPRLRERAKEVGARAGVQAESLEGLLEALDRRLAAEKQAIQRAGKEAFDRLLESLDPAQIREQAAGRGLKAGLFHKASVIEAWEEKFAQVKAYHQSGRLVGDLRASFQKYAAGAAGDEEGS